MGKTVTTLVEEIDFQGFYTVTCDATRKREIQRILERMLTDEFEQRGKTLARQKECPFVRVKDFQLEFTATDKPYKTEVTYLATAKVVMKNHYIRPEPVF